MAKHLKWEDMKSHENLAEERQNYSDAQARNLGYASAEVLRLSDYLSNLAGKWRRTKEESIVHEYGKTLYNMILKGYDIDYLDIQDHLPSELMPEIPSHDVLEAILGVYKKRTLK